MLSSDMISWKTMYVESIEKQPNLKILNKAVIVSNIIYYIYLCYNNLNLRFVYGYHNTLCYSSLLLLIYCYT